MKVNPRHGRVPRSYVDVGPEVTVKRFAAPGSAEHELKFFQAVPWACPEVLDADAWSITMRTHEPAFDNMDWRPVDALWELVSSIHEAGVAHRDLHILNVLRDPEGAPLLIDWECATFVRSLCSYDLYGPEASKVPVPDLHVRLKVTPAWWYSPERHSIHNQWGF